MTEIYNTPKVIHILETDKDGNKMTVRYIREDIINDFVIDMQRKTRCDAEKNGRTEILRGGQHGFKKRDKSAD